MRRVLAIALFALLVSCHSIGRSFKSDVATLSRLEVGKTTPDEAVEILGGEPYIRQNLPNGTLAWHWQHIQAGAYVGVTDNRYMVLIFDRPAAGEPFRFKIIQHAQNIDLPSDMPFGAVVK